MFVEVAVEGLAGAEIPRDHFRPGVEGLLRQLPLPAAGPGGRAGSDHQLRDAFLDLIGDVERRIAEGGGEVVRFGERGGVGLFLDLAELLFPGGFFQRRMDLREAPAPRIGPSSNAWRISASRRFSAGVLALSPPDSATWVVITTPPSGRNRRATVLSTGGSKHEVRRRRGSGAPAGAGSGASEKA